jgi:hypothetical protein
VRHRWAVSEGRLARKGEEGRSHWRKKTVRKEAGDGAARRSEAAAYRTIEEDRGHMGGRRGGHALTLSCDGSHDRATHIFTPDIF